MESRSKLILGAVVGLILAFGLIWFVLIGGKIKAVAPSEWTTSTPDPATGLSGPEVPPRGGYANTMCLGKSDTALGDPGNSASVPAVNCGDDTDKWCEVTFLAKLLREDNEKIKVTISNNVRPALVAYIQDDSNNKKFRLSKKGCTASCVVDFSTDTGGDQSSIESQIYVWGVIYQCNSEPRTNKSSPFSGITGKLYNSAGTLLNADNTVPPSTP